MALEFSPKDLRNLNGTAAGLIARSLDASDQNPDGKISGSAWNAYLGKIEAGETIGNDETISIVTAMNRLTKYFVRKVAGSNNINSTTKKWLRLADTDASGTNLPKLGDLKPAEPAETPQSAELENVGRTAESAGVTEITDDSQDDTQTQSEKAVKTILNNAGIEVDQNSDDFKDIVAKYDLMLDVANGNNQTLTEETIKTKVTNYAKALKFHQFELGALKNNNTTFQSDCSSATTEAELKDKYIQFGKEYLELMDKDNSTDSDGNVTVDLHEMFFRELVDYYSERGLTKHDAKQKACDTVKEFGKYNFDIPPTEDSHEAEMFTDIILKFATLDTDGDKVINAKEAGAYLLSMAQLNDQDNNITGSENMRTQLGLATQDMDLEEIKEFILEHNMITVDENGNADENKLNTLANNILSYSLKFQTNLDTATKFLNGEISLNSL